MSYPGGRGRADYLELGTWNTVCYQCGFKRKANTLLRYWQGYYVCPEHWEARQPQDFVRSIIDNQTPPWAQPASVQYAYFCSANDTSAVAGSATAGCAQAGFLSPLFILSGV